MQAPIWKCQLRSEARPGLKGNGSPFFSLTRAHQPAHPLEVSRGPQRGTGRCPTVSRHQPHHWEPPQSPSRHPRPEASLQPCKAPPSSPSAIFELTRAQRPKVNTEAAGDAAKVQPLPRMGRGRSGQTKPSVSPPPPRSWKPESDGAGAHAPWAPRSPLPQLKRFLF